MPEPTKINESDATQMRDLMERFGFARVQIEYPQYHKDKIRRAISDDLDRVIERHRKTRTTTSIENEIKKRG